MGNKNPLPVSEELRGLTNYGALLHESTLGAWEVDVYNSIVYDRLTAGQIEANLQLTDSLKAITHRTLTREETWLVTEMDDGPSADTVAASLEGAKNDEKELRPGIAELRQKLGQLSGWQQKMLDEYMSNSIVPIFVDMKARSGAKGQSWASWLANTANKEQFMNFFQWQVYNHAKQRRSPYVVEKIQNRWQEFTEATTLGIKQGWLSSIVAGEKLESRVKKVHVGDIFSTYLEGEAASADTETGEILVYQGEGKDHFSRLASLIGRLNESLFHEYSHLVFSGFEAGSWLDEGLAEHVNLAMKNGKPELIDPTARKETAYDGKGKEPPGIGDYQSEREVIAALGVDPFFILRAYSGSDIEKEAFRRAVDDWWGVERALDKINAKVIKYRQIAEQKCLPKVLPDEWARRYSLNQIRDELTSKPELIFGETKAESEQIILSEVA